MVGNTKTFGTAFNCMDGRCQDAVAAYVRAKFGVDYVDAITGAGMDALLPGEKKVHEDQPKLGWWKFEGEISAKKHGSSQAVVVGHVECGGNSVSNDEHFSDIRKAVEIVRSWNLFKTVVPLLAFQEADGAWAVKEVGA